MKVFLKQLIMENNVADTDITLEHSTAVEKSIQENVNHYYNDRGDIEKRLMELDNEWDVERVLQAMAAGLTLTGILLGTKQNKNWLSLPVVASSFLLSHAIAGWCPPLPLLKALGFRVRAEIDKEKYALKALRGAVNNVLPVPNAVWNAVNK
jgi:hypothetical protein